MLGVRREARGGDDVDRQHQFHPVPFRLRHHLFDLRDLVGFEQRVTDLVALCGQERVGHAAADDYPVGPVEQVRDHRELVRRLRPAQHDHVRPFRVGGQPAEHLDLGQHQVTGRVRQPLRHVVDAGVLAVHGPEPVADVEVAEQRELAGELPAHRVVLAGLGRLVPDVLQQRDVAVGEPGHDPGGVPPHHVGGEGDRLAEQLAEPGRHRPQRRAARGPLGVIGALGQAEVRYHDHAGTPAEQLLDGRQAGPDPPVIGDTRVRRVSQVQRHVQVGPQQHAPAADREVFDALHFLLSFRSAPRPVRG